MPLSNNQKRFLRTTAHVLKPVIMVGQRGVTDAVLQEFDLALSHHELVKIRLSNGDRTERAAEIEAMTKASGAELVQSIGHTASFYRRNPDQPQINLPR